MAFFRFDIILFLFFLAAACLCYPSCAVDPCHQKASRMTENKNSNFVPRTKNDEFFWHEPKGAECLKNHRFECEVRSLLFAAESKKQGQKGPFLTSPERESQRRLNAKSYFFRTAQNDFSARFRIGQKYAQPESALKPILDLFFFPRGVVFSQSPAKSLFFSV